MTLVDKVYELHHMMKHHATFEVRGKACISPKDWERLLHNIDRWDEQRTRFIYEGLLVLKEAWQEIHMVWTRPHINPEMWENYNWMFSSDVLEEQQLLTAARRNFREKWNTFKQNYKVYRNGTKKTSKQEGSGSDTTGTVEEVS